MLVLQTSIVTVNDASRIVNYDSIVTLQIVTSLTDNSRGVICNRKILLTEFLQHRPKASLLYLPIEFGRAEIG